MKELTANEKLDEALKHLTKHQHGSYMWYFDNNENKNLKDNDNPQKELETRLYYHFRIVGIKQSEYLPIINQLIDDGYLDPFYGYSEKIPEHTKSKDLKLEPKQIRVTFKGMKFYESGGYTGEAKKLNEEKERNDNNQKWMLILTVILAISSFVAIIYYIKEIRCS